MDVEEVTYRDGGLDDVAAVAVVAAAVRAEEPADWVERITRGLSRPSCHLVLACAGERVVGYGKAGPCYPTGAEDPAPAGYYLSGLAVLDGWRRRGLATELIRRRLTRPLSAGEAAWSFTNSINAGSLAVHLRLGFRDVGRASSYLGVTFDSGVGVLLRADPGCDAERSRSSAPELEP